MRNDQQDTLDLTVTYGHRQGWWLRLIVIAALALLLISCDGSNPADPADDGNPPAPETPELPERWSVQRKTELVLRLMRGEALDTVSRESQVPAHELENWKRVFLETGTRGLKTRSDPEERELTLARAKIGELMMRLELAEYLIEKRGLTEEWKRQRR